MMLRAIVTGNLAQAMDKEVLRVAGALRRAVSATGLQAQEKLRAQARSGGFRDGGKSIANAWRLKIYPPPGVGIKSLRPAAQITSKMPLAVMAFDSGKPIRAKGGKFLAIPTAANKLRGGNTRITAAQMARLPKGETFILKSKTNPGVCIWNVTVRAASNVGRRFADGRLRKGRMKLVVGAGVDVLTGNRKGKQAYLRDTLAKGFLPMFVLVKQVSLRKRLSVDTVRRDASGIFAQHAVQQLTAGNT